MTFRRQTRDEHLRNNGLPKRILALDGGGLRGILTLGILEKIETVLRKRHGDDPEFRLCHYFDLIAGTSTGSIIAATLAMGLSVEEIRGKYMELGQGIFEKSLFRKGLLRAKYDKERLIRKLQGVFGPDLRLGDPALQTGLLVMAKRLDTGSPWPISNNPGGKYFASRPGGTIGNGDYPLWQVVRASTAAPAFFDPETLRIIDRPGQKPVEGEFVDGGVSPFNNPAFQALLYATLDGYRIGWPTGADKLLLVSVGTGSGDPDVKGSWSAAEHALRSLVSLMGDCAWFQELLLQWMSSSPTARELDRELGDLQHDLVGGSPVLSYLRYNVDLRASSVRALKPDLKDSERIESLSSMDVPENMGLLHELGIHAADRDVQESHFGFLFDLPQT